MGSKTPSPQYLPSVQSQSGSSSGTSSGTSTTSPDPLARLAYEQTLANANRIAQTPYEPYQGQMVAGFTPDTLAGFQNVRNTVGVQNPYLAQSGDLFNQSLSNVNNPLMNQTQDYLTAAMYSTANPQMNFARDYTNQAVQAAANSQMQAAQNAFNAAMGYTTNTQLPTSQQYFQQSFGTAINPLMPQAQQLTGQAVNTSDIANYNQQALNRYMNPYQQSVVDATLGQMKQNQDVLQNQNTANAIRQGAYGGSGQFMGQAELGRQQALANAQTLAGLNAQNYQQAMQQYNQQQQQAIQAQQNAAQLLGQLGYQQAGLSTNALQQAAQTLGQLGYQQAALKAQTAAQEAQTMGQLGQQEAALRSAAYQQGAQTMGQLGQQQASLGATTATNAAQLMGQLGGQQAERGIQAYQNAAQGVAGLGKQAQQANLTDAQALMASGEAQRALAQQQLTNNYNQWLQAKAYPYQQTSYFGGLAGGLGPLLGQTATQQATQSSNTSSSGTGISPYMPQQQGGGTIPGILSTLGSFITPFFPRANGGAVTERKHFADGGTNDDSDLGLGSLSEVMGSTPYSSSKVDSPVTSKVGLGALMTSTPYSAPDDYISSAAKLSKVIKPASSEARSQLLSQINKAIDLIPGMQKPDFDLIEGNMKKWPKYGSESSDSSADYEKLGKTFGQMASSPKVRNYVSEKISSLGSLLESDGGRVGYADGGTPAQQYAESQAAKSQAQQILADYKNQFGRNVGQPNFDALVYATSGMSPEQTRAVVQNSPGDFGSLSTSTPMSNYDRLLQQAYALNPGPQLTPEQQGRPGMPSADYYYQKSPSYPGIASGINAVGGFKNLAQSMTIPATYAEPTAEGKSAHADFVNAVFDNYLARRPTQDEMNWNLDLMKKGTKPIDIENSILSSTEGKNTDFILRSFADLTGRNVDRETLDTMKSMMSQGMSARNMRSYIANSPEVMNLPADFRGTAPVQGYFTKIANTQVNPYTGLFNVDYTAPYRGQTVSDFLPREEGGRVEKSRGGTLSKEDIARAALQAGATPQEAAILTAIAMPESAGNPYAHNTKGRDNSYGLWQINMLGGMGPERVKQFGLSSYNDLYDPVTNAKAALELLRSKRGANHWSTYLSGRYKPYYSTAANIVNSLVKDPAAVKAPIQVPEYVASSVPHPRGASERYIMGHERPRTREELGLFTQPQGYDTFKRQPEWYSSSMGAAKDRTMLPETPETVSSANFPMSSQPMGTGFSEEVLAQSDENAPTAQKTENQPAKKYWGDYRDVEGSSFGDFIDELAGDIRTANKPGTREMAMGKYQGQGGLGALFDLAGTNPYAEPKPSKKEEEGSDFGSIFDIFS